APATDQPEDTAVASGLVLSGTIADEVRTAVEDLASTHQLTLHPQPGSAAAAPGATPESRHTLEDVFLQLTGRSLRWTSPLASRTIIGRELNRGRCWAGRLLRGLGSRAFAHDRPECSRMPDYRCAICFATVNNGCPPSSCRRLPWWCWPARTGST